MRRPALRATAVVLGLPTAVVAGVAVGSLADDAGVGTAFTLAAALAPVVAYAWVADRWWAAFPLPILVGTTYLTILRIVDAKTGGCSICGEDEDWSNYPYWFALTAVVPITFVVAVVTGIRRSRDHSRMHPDR